MVPKTWRVILAILLIPTGCLCIGQILKDIPLAAGICSIAFAFAMANIILE